MDFLSKFSKYLFFIQWWKFSFVTMQPIDNDYLITIKHSNYHLSIYAKSDLKSNWIEIVGSNAVLSIKIRTNFFLKKNSELIIFLSNCFESRYGLPDPIYINIVRDPVERVISWFYYGNYFFVYLKKAGNIQNKTLHLIELYLLMNYFKMVLSVSINTIIISSSAMVLCWTKASIPRLTAARSRMAEKRLWNLRTDQWSRMRVHARRTSRRHRWSSSSNAFLLWTWARLHVRKQSHSNIDGDKLCRFEHLFASFFPHYNHNLYMNFACHFYNLLISLVIFWLLFPFSLSTCALVGHLIPKRHWKRQNEQSKKTTVLLVFLRIWIQR